MAFGTDLLCKEKKLESTLDFSIVSISHIWKQTGEFDTMWLKKHSYATLTVILSPLGKSNISKILPNKGEV